MLCFSHARLRAPKSHELYPFDHNMRVMLHEMAHIVHGNHSAQFYQQMDELSKQYETLLAKGQVLDEKNMPIVGGRKADTSQHNAASMREARLQGLAAAERRAQQGRVLGGSAGERRLASVRGQRLGGGGPGGAGGRSAGGDGGATAAEQRQRKWDADHGLEAADFEAVAREIALVARRHRRGRGAGAGGRAAARADRCVGRQRCQRALQRPVDRADPPARDAARHGAGRPAAAGRRRGRRRVRIWPRDLPPRRRHRVRRAPPPPRRRRAAVWRPTTRSST